MDLKKLKTYKEKLLAKKTEILDAYSKNKISGMEADGDGAQDVADKAASSYTKEFLFSLSSAERELIQDLDEALQRLDEKKFGRCTSCGSDLNQRRLEAVPWASLCFVCQEKQEQGLL